MNIRVRNDLFQLKVSSGQLAVFTESHVPLLYVLDDGTHYYAPLGRYLFNDQKLESRLFFYSILRGVDERWIVAKHIRNGRYFLERQTVRYPLLKMDDIVTVLDKKSWKTFRVQLPDYDLSDGLVVGDMLWVFPTN